MNNFNKKNIPYALLLIAFLLFQVSYGQQINASPGSQTIEVFPGSVGSALMGISVLGATQNHVLNYSIQPVNNPPGVIFLQGGGTVFGDGLGFGFANFQRNVTQTTQVDYIFRFNYTTNQGGGGVVFTSVRVIYYSEFPCDGTDQTISQNLSNTTKRFRASNNLASTSEINNSNIIFTAGNRIRLSPGFHAKPGSNVDVLILECRNSRDNDSVSETRNTLSEIEIEPKITLYPNPVSDRFTIQSDLEIDKWEFTNQYGLRSITGEPSAEEATKVNVDISNYPKGVYFLNIYLKNGKIVNKTIMKE